MNLERGIGVVAVIVILAVLAVLGGTAYVATQNRAEVDIETDGDDGGLYDDTDTNTGTDIDADIDADVDVDANVQTNATVSYTSSGFSPQTVTIKKGGTVTWTNNSSADMWVASAMHPTHTVYPGSALSKCDLDLGILKIFDQCANSASFSFTFNEVGEWGYHNHSQANFFGKVIVVE